MGDRANAIKVAEAHVRRLREEFDLEPDREILATIERIRRGELPAQAVAVVPAAAAPAGPPSPGAAAPPPQEAARFTGSARRIPRWAPWAAAAAALVLGGAFAAEHLRGTRVELSAPLGDTYHYLRRYPEAIAAYRQTSAFAPDLVQPRLSLGWSYFLWRGELDTLRGILRGLPLEVDPGWGGGSLTHQRLMLLLWERRPDSVLALLRSMRPAPEANAEAVVTRALVAAEAYRLGGDTAAARAGFESVATLLAEDRTHPEIRLPTSGGGWLWHRSAAAPMPCARSAGSSDSRCRRQDRHHGAALAVIEQRSPGRRCSASTSCD